MVDVKAQVSFTGSGNLSDQLKKIEKSGKGIRSEFQNLNKETTKLDGFTTKLDKSFSPLLKNLKEGNKTLELSSKQLKDLKGSASSVKVITETIVPMNDSFKESVKVLGKSSVGFEKLNNDASSLSKTFKDSAKTGTSFSESLEKVGSGVEKTASIASVGASVSKVVTGLKKISSSMGSIFEDTSESVRDAIDFSQDFGITQLVIGGKVGALTKAVSLLDRTIKNNLTASIKGFLAAGLKVSGLVSTFRTISGGVAQMRAELSGANDALSLIQGLGINTSAAEMAFSFGLMGEQLLFSAQAAEEFGRAAIQSFAQLEDASAFVTTLGSGANLQFGNLASGVESVAAFTNELTRELDNSVSSVEAASSLYNALSAGIGVAKDNTIQLGQTQAFLNASLRLSSGTGADAASTLDLLAKTTKVYGLSNNEAAITAAKLNQIVEQGQVTFSQLTGNLGRTLSVAKAAGVGLDEAAGSVAALTRVMSADDAQTGFASLLQSIAGQGAQAKSELQELGVRFDVNSIKAKGLNASLKELYNATGGNAEALKKIIPDALAFQTALTLMTSASNDAAVATENVANAGEDSLNQVFNNRQQSLIARTTNLMNGFNEVLVDFGRRALPVVEPGLKFLESALSILEQLPEPIKQFIGGLIILQTGLNNVLGAGRAFIATFAQMALSIIGFRLAGKAMGGQLETEVKILRQLITVDKDLIGFTKRLIGLNEQYDTSTIQVNSALIAQKKAKENLNKVSINLDGEKVKDFKNSLNSLQEKIKEFKKNPLSVIDPPAFKKEMAELKRTERQLKKTIKLTSVIEIPEERKFIPKIKSTFTRAAQVSNNALKEIANDKTKAVVNSNLNKLGSGVVAVNKKIGEAGRVVGSGLESSLNGLSGVVGIINPKLGSLVDTFSLFVGSTGQLQEGFRSVQKSLGGVAEKTGVAAVATRVMSTSQVQATGTTLGLAAAQTAENATTATGSKLKAFYAIMTSKVAVAQGLATATTVILTTATMGLNAALLATWTFLAPILAGAATFAAPIIAAGFAVWALVKALGDLIPVLGRLIDSYKRLAFQSKEVNSDLALGLEAFKATKNAVDTNTRTVKKYVEANKEINKVTDKLKAPPRAFVQGWRGIVLTIGESLVGSLNFFVRETAKLGPRILATFGAIGKGIFENSPIMSKFFDELENRGRGALKVLDKVSFGITKKFRKAFNFVRENLQASITKEALAAQMETVEALATQAISQAPLVKAQKEGKAFNEESKRILTEAKKAERALTGNELSKIIQLENQANQAAIDLNNQAIGSLEELMGKIKDPAIKKGYQDQIDILVARNTELEKGNKLSSAFMQSQNAIASTMTNNQVGESEAQLYKRLSSIYNQLPASAKAAFKETSGLQTKFIQKTREDFENDFDFDKFLATNKEGMEEAVVGVTANIGTSIQRRSAQATGAAQAELLANIARISDVDNPVTQDQLSQGVLNLFDAVEKQIQEDPNYSAMGQKLLDGVLNQQLDAGTESGSLFDALNPADLQEVQDRLTTIVGQSAERRVSKQNRALKQVAVLEQSATITSVEAAKERSRLQIQIDQSEIQERMEVIAVIEKLNNGETEESKRLAKDLADFKVGVELGRLNEKKKIFDEELKLLQEQKNNEVQAIKNTEQRTLNTFQLTEKANQQELKSLASRRDVSSAMGNLETSLLENKSKLATDVEEKAKIDLELTKKRVDLSRVENEFEKENIKLQQTINGLALDREQIALRIQKAEIAADKAANNAKLAAAETNRLTVEEVKAIELQNEALQLRSELVSSSQSQLKDFADQQNTLNEQQLEAMNLKQQAIEVSSQAELEIAQRNIVLASYDKEIEKVRLVAREVDVSNQERQVGLGKASSLLDNQTKILEEQKGLMDSMSNTIQQNFQIAIQAERNEFRKRRLEEEAARQKLKSLEIQQKIELTIFKINEQQKDLALEVRQIELSASREKAAADIAVAEAEAAKVKADPNATSEQIKASELSIRAAQAQLSSVEAQKELASQERAINAQGADLRSLQFRQQQSSAVDQGRADIASTTRRTSDDRQQGREALARGRKLEEEFTSIADTFLNRVVQPISANSILSPTLSKTRSSIPQPQTTKNANQKVEGKIDLNLNLTVDGDSSSIDPVKLQKIANESVSDGLLEFFDEIKVRGKK